MSKDILDGRVLLTQIKIYIKTNKKTIKAYLILVQLKSVREKKDTPVITIILKIVRVIIKTVISSIEYSHLLQSQREKHWQRTLFISQKK